MYRKYRGGERFSSVDSRTRYFIWRTKMNWFFGKKKSPPIKSRSPETRREKLLKLAQSDLYYSVTLTRCGCKAYSRFIGKGFSFDKAPPLPLKDCTASHCTCEYQGVINRRKIKRRTIVRRMSVRFDDDRRKVNRRMGEALWNKYSV